jgi:hypothetical protein
VRGIQIGVTVGVIACVLSLVFWGNERSYGVEGGTRTPTLVPCIDAWYNCVDVKYACSEGSSEASQYACGAGFHCCLPVTRTATATKESAETVTPTATPKPIGTPTLTIDQRLDQLEATRDRIWAALDEIELILTKVITP